jgi:hypothetical protein
MRFVVDNFNSPSHRISGDGKYRAVCESGHRRTILFRFSRFDLRFGLFNTR